MTKNVEQEEQPISCINRFILTALALTAGCFGGWGVLTAIDHLQGQDRTGAHTAIVPDAQATGNTLYPGVPRTVVPSSKMLQDYLTPVPGQIESSKTDELINWLKEFQTHPEISTEFSYYLRIKANELEKLSNEGKLKVIIEKGRKTASATFYLLMLETNADMSSDEHSLVFKINLPDSEIINPSKFAHEACHVFFRASAFQGNQLVFDNDGTPIDLEEFNLHAFLEEEYLCMIADRLTSYYYSEQGYQEFDEEYFKDMGLKVLQITAFLDQNGMLLRYTPETGFTVGNLYSAIIDYEFYEVMKIIHSYHLSEGITDEKSSKLKESMIGFFNRLNARNLTPEEKLCLDYFLQAGMITEEVYSGMLDTMGGGGR